MKRISRSDLSFFILIIMTLFMLLDNFMSPDKVMILGHYLGASMAALSLVFYFTAYRYFKYLMLFVLLLGTFNLIYFSNPVYTLNIRLEVFKNVSGGLYFQTASLLLLFIHLVLNARLFYRDLRSLFDNQR